MTSDNISMAHRPFFEAVHIYNQTLLDLIRTIQPHPMNTEKALEDIRQIWNGYDSHYVDNLNVPKS
jgi:hypothetical protein